MIIFLHWTMVDIDKFRENVLSQSMDKVRVCMHCIGSTEEKCFYTLFTI